MTANPYHTLDVPPDADSAAVKRAYRRKAAETHPDKGGSEEAFTEVAGAWMVLRDPVRRARYDATGETNAPVDDRMARISQMLCSIFDALINQADVDHVNIVEQVRLNIRGVRKTSVANSQGATAQLKKVESARRRLSFKGKGGDFIAAMLNDKIFTIRKTIGDLEREQDACDGALLYVEDYIYAVDVREPEPWDMISTRMNA